MTAETNLLSEPDGTSWAELASNSETVPDDDSSPVNEPADSPPKGSLPVCVVCGETIAWAGKGRRPKYHPEHRPNGRTSSGSTSLPKSGAATKAEREAAAIAETLLRGLNRTALLVATVDQYDGLAIAAGAKGIAGNAKNVLAEHDKLRQLFADAKGNGSVVGLIFACFMVGLPILAHHGIIPAEIGTGPNKRPVGKLLEQLPHNLIKLSQAADTAAERLAQTIADGMPDA